MRTIVLVLALVACSSPTSTPPSKAGARGDACTGGLAPQGSCGAGLMCLPARGGYCASFCSANGTPCSDGTCMDTGRGGAVCARTCASDADCRTAEGYACDPVWHACSMPGMSAPKAPVCAAPKTMLAKTAFGAATAVTTAKTPGVYQFEPSAAVSADGSIVAIYTTGAAMGALNEPRVAVIAGDAVREAPLPHDREHAFDAWLARDGRGTMHAVWLAFDGPGAPEKRMEIAYSVSRDGGATWSAPRAIQDPLDCPDGMPGCMDKPMVATGPGTGDVRIAYSTEAKGREGVRMITSHDGGQTFAPSVAVMDASYGDLAIDGAGAIHVVGADGSPKTGAFGAVGQTIDYTVSTDGGATFAAPVHVNGDGESIPFFFVNPGVEVDDTRHIIYVSYARAAAATAAAPDLVTRGGAADAAWDIVLAASSDHGATWTRTVVNDDGHCAAHMIPELAVEPSTGRVHVTWLDDRDGHGALAYAVCEPGGARCGANQRVSDAPFAAFSFVRHAGPWMGEYGSLVVDDVHHVLHAVWTQPVATPAGPVSRVFTASAPLR